ncbi:MAG: 3-hydroxyacyl-CoA dehydrogenase [Gammaproteobacteria bacterium]|nr:3-hydroxyacyl-CoA dehydrogenase [Gammaproteobacteria bacterium]NIR90366.1 3-hydroxyacyl-CoA dehydrogenase [Gammaproteobacteria bacterium]NIU03318.1 3-hydroxyacyl-CoA dehydrogenase [Gammaproteobacteria bacterium]NIV50813.1 3-hydroxyacyl-CoA dehydrogenase [Gammaproteobacteria bacterium]NIW85725.1 3-hydroxyacyl-CoA dehydrogenase [Gammaproteobacteria bacterium]
MMRVAVLGGGGLMGHGIALACLQGTECEVVLVSRRGESLFHGRELIVSGPYGLERAVARGKLDAERARVLEGRIVTTTDYAEGLAGADMVFESIPEVVADKQAALAAVERLAPPEALLATGTSAITIATLASALRAPARLVGTHWFYPANVMPLVEVAVGDATDPGIAARMLEFLCAIGKRPVRVGDAPGFFMTRFINNFIAEAIRLVELGVAGPAEVDEMVKTGLGWPMGVFELLDDAAAFDSWYHAQEYLHATCGERYVIPNLARRAFEAGYRGNPKLKPDSRGGWYEFLNANRSNARSGKTRGGSSN